MQKIIDWAKANKAVSISVGVIVGGLFFCCVFGLILQALGVEPKEDKAQKEKVAVTTTRKKVTSDTKEKVTTTVVKTTTATTNTVPKPVDVKKVVLDKVKKELGESNRDAKTRVKVEWDAEFKTITVTWAIDENLTEGLTKDTARIETVEILEGVKKSKIDYAEVICVGTFPLVDAYGNESEEKVVNGGWYKSTVDKIKFDTFDFKNVFDISDGYYIHPTFEY